MMLVALVKRRQNNVPDHPADLWDGQGYQLGLVAWSTPFAVSVARTAVK